VTHDYGIWQSIPVMYRTSNTREANAHSKEIHVIIMYQSNRDPCRMKLWRDPTKKSGVPLVPLC